MTITTTTETNDNAPRSYGNWTKPKTAGLLGLSALGTAILFGGIQELVAALTRYRVWDAWRFFISAVVIGILVAVVVAFAADLASLPLLAQIIYLIVAVLGPVAWTAAGLGIGVSLRRAGVARRA